MPNLTFCRKKELLDDPERIGNLDEIGFRLGCDDARVIVQKGGRRIEGYTKGTNSIRYSILMNYLLFLFEIQVT